ncbi:MAG: hypothetical protein OXE94_00125 [Aestuariivita sp.]|nr:hypothetical protein [Aestuariivita sp.]MCY4202125.1 hypothetical protein [Aestuariivita sp.]
MRILWPDGSWQKALPGYPDRRRTGATASSRCWWQGLQGTSQASAYFIADVGRDRGGRIDTDIADMLGVNVLRRWSGFASPV